VIDRQSVVRRHSFHDQGAARRAGRLAVNTATMASWGWHSMPSQEEFTLDQAMSAHQTTVADPSRAQVAFRVESALLASGQAGIAVRFPYASDGFFQTSDWSSPGRHDTALHRVDERACRFTRILDQAAYTMRLDFTSGQISPGDGPHEFVLSSKAAAIEIVAGFWPAGGTALGRASFAKLRDRKPG